MELSSVRPPASGDIYSECVTVRVWMRAEGTRGGGDPLGNVPASLRVVVVIVVV